MSEQLNIQSSTLRKYADVLEKEGYTFIKNERGHRKYRESDVMVFRKVINLKNDTDMTLENATKQIVSWHQGVEVLPLERHEIERYEEPDFNATTLQTMLRDQNEVIEKQNELLQELSKRLIEQDQRFAQRESELLSAIQTIQESQVLIATNSSEDVAKNQGRDEILMQTIREVQEVKKMIAASKDKKWYEFWK
ncbi:DNA-binding protein [Bacillus toyonensis]|nr:DNA-binding protein [Bacillus toyonensis]PHD30557.1 DNA-binding protein [Bacillus toyonensis]SDL60791.1 MerR HTH family regulatory protein [Bacillus toyonensis]